MHACAIGDLPFGKTVCPAWFEEDFGRLRGVAVWLVLCEDELWLEPLDFAPAGVAASAAATMAMDKDKANRVFSIVIPPNTNRRRI